jgi:hypothetical protein
VNSTETNLNLTNKNPIENSLVELVASPVQAYNTTSPVTSSRNAAAAASANLTPTITITAPPVDTSMPMDSSVSDQLPPTAPHAASASTKPDSKKSLRKSSFAAGKNFLIQRRKTIHDIINLDIFNSFMGDSKAKANPNGNSSGSHGGSSYFLNKSNTPNDSNASSKSSSKKFHVSTNNLSEKPSTNETIAALCKQTLATVASVATRDIAESLAPLSPPESHTSTTSLSAQFAQLSKLTASSPPLLTLPPQPHMNVQQQLSMNPAVSSSHSIGLFGGMHKSSTTSNIATCLQVKTSSGSMYSLNSDAMNKTAMAEQSNSNKIDFSVPRELVKQGSVQLVNVRIYQF